MMLAQVVIQQSTRPLEDAAREAPDLASAFLVFVAFAVGVFIYLLPTIVASSRGHHQRNAIAVLNLLLGWTALGWIIALVWACTATR